MQKTHILCFSCRAFKKMQTSECIFGALFKFFHTILNVHTLLFQLTPNRFESLFSFFDSLLFAWTWAHWSAIIEAVRLCVSVCLILSPLSISPLSPVQARTLVSSLFHVVAALGECQKRHKSICVSWRPGLAHLFLYSAYRVSISRWTCASVQDW